MYVSNESDEPVYFDNLQVSQVHGRIIEEDHYYAYGLKIAAISSRKLGDVNEGYLKNNNLYQGDFSELDEDIGWNDFELRNYDPQIGRWVQHDPFDEFASPYLGMGNDPVNNVDPNGGSAMTALAGGTGLLIAGTTIVGAMVGAVAGAKQGGVKGALEGGLIGAAVGLLNSIGSVGNIIGKIFIGSGDIWANVANNSSQLSGPGPRSKKIVTTVINDNGKDLPKGTVRMYGGDAEKDKPHLKPIKVGIEVIDEGEDQGDIVYYTDNYGGPFGEGVYNFERRETSRLKGANRVPKYLLKEHPHKTNPTIIIPGFDFVIPFGIPSIDSSSNGTKDPVDKPGTVDYKWRNLIKPKANFE